jgi:hypothetical protein
LRAQKPAVNDEVLSSNLQVDQLTANTAENNVGGNTSTVVRSVEQSSRLSDRVVRSSYSNSLSPLKEAESFKQSTSQSSHNNNNNNNNVYLNPSDQSEKFAKSQDVRSFATIYEQSNNDNDQDSQRNGLNPRYKKLSLPNKSTFSDYEENDAFGLDQDPDYMAARHGNTQSDDRDDEDHQSTSSDRSDDRDHEDRVPMRGASDTWKPNAANYALDSVINRLNSSDFTTSDDDKIQYWANANYNSYKTSGRFSNTTHYNKSINLGAEYISSEFMTGFALHYDKGLENRYLLSLYSKMKFSEDFFAQSAVSYDLASQYHPYVAQVDAGYNYDLDDFKITTTLGGRFASENPAPKKGFISNAMSWFSLKDWGLSLFGKSTDLDAIAAVRIAHEFKINDFCITPHLKISGVYDVTKLILKKSTLKAPHAIISAGVDIDNKDFGANLNFYHGHSLKHGLKGISISLRAKL